jgi:hypothetical protein
MYIPLMERACGRVHFLDEFFYLYNAGTGLNQKQPLSIGGKELEKKGSPPA